MLIDQAWKDGDVCSIKMANGDELVAKITNHDASTITLRNPMVLTLAMDQMTQQYQLQMSPTYMFSVRKDSKLIIDRRHVITIAPSEDAAKENYQTSVQNLLNGK